MEPKPHVAQIEALTPADRAVALLLAVVAMPVARSHILPCIKALSLRRDDGRQYTSQNLGDLFEDLAKRGLATYYTYVALTPDVAWTLLTTTPRAALDPPIAVARQHFPLDPDRPNAATRELALALIDRDADKLADVLAWTAAHDPKWAAHGALRGLPAAAVDHARATDPALFALIAADRLRLARADLAPTPDGDLVADLKALAAHSPLPAAADLELARHLVLRGRLDDARAAASRHPTDPATPALLGLITAASGDRDAARAAAAGLLPPARRARGQAPPPATLERVIATLVLLGDPATRAAGLARRSLGALTPAFQRCLDPLEALEVVLLNGELPEDSEFTLSWRHTPTEGGACAALCTGLAYVVAKEEPPPELLADLKTLPGRAEEAGASWLAGELTALLHALDPSAAAPAPSPPTLLRYLEFMPPWERRLQRLEQALKPPAAPTRATPAKADNSRVRLVWTLDTAAWSGGLTVAPREQRRDAKGRWSKGRPVALKRLHGGRPEYEPLTDADRAVCACIEESVQISRGYRDVSYYLDTELAVPALAAHPHVYWADDPSHPVAVRELEPVLRVTREADDIVLKLEPRATHSGRLKKTGPAEASVVRVRDVHERIDRVVGDGLRVPAREVARVERIIAAVSGAASVQSDFGAPTPAAEEVAADPRPVVQLSPLGDGLAVRVRVRPLGPDGPALAPGSGAVVVSTRRGDRTPTTTRDHAEEAARADALLMACPTLLSGAVGASGEWELAERAPSLDLLLELADLGDQVVVEWPAGEPVSVVAASAQALRLRVSAGSGGYFELSGELTVDADLALEMAELLRLIGQSPDRFIPLSPGRFLALTQRLRDQLATLSRVAEARPKGRVALHPWAASAVDSLADEVAAFKAAAAWRERVRAQRDAARFDPPVPPTLRASLRAYQRDGFRWLARLAQLEAGACLADDMGLGKTVQTLALLVHRAPAGPQLVVCPTSVVGAWQDEAARFAPTLRLLTLGATDRAATVTAAGPFDLLVTSYGLLQSEAATLAARRWETAVLDEAQTIKNPDTLRAKAAFDLDAAFRMVLTGTPVENRLDELWSLFHFLVPGLLGTRGGFQERFARPIEVAGDAAARQALRQLVRPLLLRRMKTDVLTELPERTETELRVDMSVDEAALYEAIRLRALDALAEHAEAPRGQLRMRVLAEITRLRRACCHPRLVVPEGVGGATDAPWRSSKLEALAELVTELRDGGHRALVYSQFVDHLAIVREWLDAEGVRYQYLDGSTPQRARQERVAAFQAGEGDLFLLSLRAGGAGLNLTAADFVIHLDPWWNPAVEDQASDRVYRIGQRRPVSVVRLIARGSIEERIVALHSAKRDLAERLLEGADAAAQLDVEALLALLEP